MTAAPHRELLDLRELFADPRFALPTISPDGRRIAYLAPHRGRRNVWVRGVDEDHDQAVAVTHDTAQGITSYWWTDDSRRLLYLRDTDGNEDWHLYRADLADPDAPAVDLTPLDPGSRVVGVEPLAGDPGRVLVTMNRRPLHFDVFRVEVATGVTELHWEQDDPTATVLFDRAGAPAFRTTVADDGGWVVSAVDPATGAARFLRRVGGPEHPMGVHPQLVTPDGQGLLIGTFSDGDGDGNAGAGDDLRLVRIDRATGAETVVAAVPGHDLDISVATAPGAPPIVHTDRHGTPLAARFVGDRAHVEVIDPDFAPVLAALSALSDGVLGTLSSDDAGRYWVATFLHDRDPGVAWLHDTVTGASRLLFRAFPDRDPARAAPMHPVRIRARDGLELPAYLTLPVAVEPARLPLVLAVHGGPWARDSWGFDPTVQFLADRGYAVLQVNFRGSLGYGRRHLTAAVGEFAGRMHDDLIDAVDWAVEQGYADADRVGIYGGSYGGYAALVAVTFTPDRFAAAVDYVGPSDLVNFLRTLPVFTRPYMVNNWYAYAGDPAVPAQAAALRARSPITRVDAIRTPLLVAQGANDVRVVQAESDTVVAALRDRGVPVEYLLADDEGHGFAAPENRLLLHRAMERHFGEHLGGRVAADPPTDPPSDPVAVTPDRRP